MIDPPAPDDDSPEALLDYHGVVQMIGLSKRTIEEMVRKKQIPHVRIGHRVLFKPGSVRRWVDDHEVDPAATETSAQEPTPFGGAEQWPA